ncbi:MAG: YheC/YheD family protein [Gorillibacterium sp.]|nr:YheC/YheD family protein [Gorillibacterium sp.]
MGNPTLGIMTLYTHGQTFDKEELSYFRQLTAVGSQLGLDVFVFDPGDAHAERQLVKAHRYDLKKQVWQQEWLPFPDTVYDRCRAQRSPRFKEMRRFRSRFPKLHYLNHPLSSKWGNQLVLERNNAIHPYLPDTRKYQGLADLKVFVKRHPFVFLKPVDGSGGRGIVRITRAEAGNYKLEGRDTNRRIIAASNIRISAIPGRLTSWGLTNRYLIQQGIPIELTDGRVHDFRLLIQKNSQGNWQVTGCAGRIGGGKSVTSNLHGGGEAIPFDKLLAKRGLSADKIADIKRDMEHLAHLSAKELEKRFGGLCELALDLAIDPDSRIWLLEVNPKPSREIFRLSGDHETYQLALRRPLEYALWSAAHK